MLLLTASREMVFPRSLSLNIVDCCAKRSDALEPDLYRTRPISLSTFSLDFAATLVAASLRCIYFRLFPLIAPVIRHLIVVLLSHHLHNMPPHRDSGGARSKYVSLNAKYRSFELCYTPQVLCFTLQFPSSVEIMHSSISKADDHSPNVNPSRTACRYPNGHHDHSKHRCYKFNAPDTRAGIRCNQCSNMGVRGQAELRAGWNCVRCGYWLCQDCFAKYERPCPSINAHTYDDNGARRAAPVSAPRR